VNQLRPFQETALDALRKQVHLIQVSPTGSGKSLIYEEFVAANKCKTLLITPLVALGRQQAERLKARNLESKVRIISPEQLSNQKTQDELKKWEPKFLVVDECHCLWDWGDKFRPAFQLIPQLIQDLKIARSLWLTATLPKTARIELKQKLKSNVVELGKFQLPEKVDLKIIKVSWAERVQALYRWIEFNPEPGIIFTGTREATRRIQNALMHQFAPVYIYHAGMSKEERLTIEKLIRKTGQGIVVATSAFGMGMDYSHLRWAVLWQAPYSLLSLAQMVGRIGRGDTKDPAIVFWDENDLRMLEWSCTSHRRKNELLLLSDFLRSNKCARCELEKYFENDSVATNHCGVYDRCVTTNNAQL
jgi:ATP-dependent DNA helicase RecQ